MPVQISNLQSVLRRRDLHSSTLALALTLSSNTCTGTKPSPSTLTDPFVKGNRELKTGTFMQCDTVVEKVIVPETSTTTEPKSPSVDLFSPPTQENLETGTIATWDMPAHPSQKNPSTIPNTSSDDSSSEGLDSSSGAKSEIFSTNSLDTRPESPSSALFDASAYENCESKPSTTPDMSAQYDSDSDAQTVILCDDNSENDSNTLPNSSSSQREPNTISSTSSGRPLQRPERS
ncbi:hypothetical protein N7537_007397 [Penicillium hordei]|uniref:Uncharacterized protein n=1 Tax=Penicillium hordei TaxID=40994 RepID=A0AAD6DZW5_9EURO|nr:uncharacterized protein N7537_007397 [Penicillium hordei]KAJ5597313.1 hypothetical protein N7537_007397 [Penicillium hordei]